MKPYDRVLLNALKRIHWIVIEHLRCILDRFNLDVITLAINNGDYIASVEPDLATCPIDFK